MPRRLPLLLPVLLAGRQILTTQLLVRVKMWPLNRDQDQDWPPDQLLQRSKRNVEFDAERTSPVLMLNQIVMLLLMQMRIRFSRLLLLRQMRIRFSRLLLMQMQMQM
jgi:hypothetical protein